jgi:hypothetical protein
MFDCVNAEIESTGTIEFAEEVEEDNPVKTKNWKDKAAFLISVLLSPFIIAPFFVFLVVSSYVTDRTDFMMYIGVMFLFSTVVPFFNVFLAVKRGKITDVHVAVREERTGPFIVGILSILAGTLVLQFLDAPREIIVLGWAMFINSLIFFGITLYWKISIHSSVLACILVSLMILVNKNFAFGFLLYPLLIWARIRRRRHNIYQGIIATVLAMLATFVLFRLFGIVS